MKRLVLTLVLIWAAPDLTARTILVMGDSISAAYGIQRTDGWVALLQERLDQHAPDFHVINASISGETTGGGLARLPKTLDAHTPEIVIIELGGNDALRGYPIDRIRENLARMIDVSRATGARVLLMGMNIPPNYGPRYTKAFHDIYHELAEQKAVKLVPFLLEGVALERELMQGDGIHPKAEAQPRLLDNVWLVLSDVLPEAENLHSE
jgi:acyl-CoA thioesterase-1